MVEFGRLLAVSGGIGKMDNTAGRAKQRSRAKIEFADLDSISVELVLAHSVRAASAVSLADLKLVFCRSTANRIEMTLKGVLRAAVDLIAKGVGLKPEIHRVEARSLNELKSSLKPVSFHNTLTGNTDLFHNISPFLFELFCWFIQRIFFIPSNILPYCIRCLL